MFKLTIYLLGFYFFYYSVLIGISLMKARKKGDKENLMEIQVPDDGLEAPKEMEIVPGAYAGSALAKKKMLKERIQKEMSSFQPSPAIDFFMRQAKEMAAYETKRVFTA